MLSSGFARVASDAAGAASYLDRTSGGRIDRPLVEALAQGMTEVPAFLEELARPLGGGGATALRRRPAPQRDGRPVRLARPRGRSAGPGIEEIPGFDGYPWVQGGPKGQLLIRVLEENIRRRPIDVWFDAPAERLLRDERTGRISGLQVRRDDASVTVEARGGVDPGDRRLRVQPRDDARLPGAADDPPDGPLRQHRRRHPDGLRGRRGALAHVAPARLVRVQAAAPAGGDPLAARRCPRRQPAAPLDHRRPARRVASPTSSRRPRRTHSRARSPTWTPRPASTTASRPG